MPPKNRSLSKQRHDSTIKITTPSPYGSHRSMVKRELPDGRLVLEDQFGDYITTADRLDTGLADPARANGDRIGRKLEYIEDNNVCSTS